MNKWKVVTIKIGDEELSFEYPCPSNMSEDEFFEEVCNYIYSNIEVEII